MFYFGLQHVSVFKFLFHSVRAVLLEHVLVLLAVPGGHRARREPRRRDVRLQHAARRSRRCELKAPRDDQVVVRIVASGICHTDLSVLRARAALPAAGGARPRGRRRRRGGGRARSRTLKPGDHVVLSSIPHCGHCAYCHAGHAHLCESGLQAAMAGAADRVRKGRRRHRPLLRAGIVCRAHRRATRPRPSRSTTTFRSRARA